MKSRIGFVSNSSSSSFIIKREHISNLQLEMIKRHIFYARELKIDEYAEDRDSWDVKEKLNEIELYTYLDNFDMYDFLLAIGVDKDYIVYND